VFSRLEAAVRMMVEAERDAGVGELPVLVMSNSPKVEKLVALLENRRVGVVLLPSSVQQMHDAIESLTPGASEELQMAA